MQFVDRSMSRDAGTSTINHRLYIIDYEERKEGKKNSRWKTIPDESSRLFCFIMSRLSTCAQE